MKTKTFYQTVRLTSLLFLMAICLVLLSISNSFSQATLSVRVNAAYDDMEEYIGGPNTLGTMDEASSDLELGYADNNSGIGANAQLVGVRFTNITIPQDAVITNAYIQFTVDAINKNLDPSSLTIVGEAADNALTFDPTVLFNLSSRPKTTTSATWDIPAASWTAAGQADADQRTSDIKSIIQEIVNRSGWVSGNALALYLSGSGLREAESFDGDAPKAPLLVIEYLVKNTLSIRVNSASDDLEEYIGGPNTIGTMDNGSSDLELGHADNNVGTGQNAQLVGIRFNGISIPQGATVTNAYIQFTVDAINKNLDPSSLTLVGEAVDNAATFDPNVPFNLSARPKTTASATWDIPAGSWTAAGQADADQRTSDIKNIIQEIINRGGWASGNSLALYLTGSGLREAESFDGDAKKAPLLVIEYLGTPLVTQPPVGNPTTDFPIAKQSSWSYLDNGSNPVTDWKAPAFTEDNTWTFGNGPLGYGDPVTTTVGYGLDDQNKYVTTYFIKRFNVSNVVNLTSTLDLHLLCDDGAIVYVNGKEVVRYNMPVGAVTNTTYATLTIGGADETTYSLHSIPSNLLINGVNMIAVEVHQSTANSSDLSFDLELKEHVPTVADNEPAMGCTEDPEHIACFTSLIPTDQVKIANIPSSHAFQVIFQNGDAYMTGGGTAPGNFDFTGFIPENMTSSVSGHLSLNHETNPGGVSMLDIHYNPGIEQWIVDNSQAISFAANSIVKTERNCSGGVTPWGTVITSEETTAAGDLNADGYQDVGWNLEIDPSTYKVKEYGTGVPQKLWAMGRMSHENVVVKSDSLTAYYGDDTGSGNIFKFVANNKMDLSSGTLYVLKLASGLVSNEPTASTGTWELVPNSTPVQCNTTKSLAAGLGATTFSGVEDVEISPHDEKIYFTAKGNSRTYRFTDNGSTVSNFETFVGGMSYQINYGTGLAVEPWGSGNDNLTFDNHGNLWVLQDGGRNHVWLVRPDHTQAVPKVELFMITPAGSEPTGMTFSPDFKFMFISIQSPNGSNTQVINDATGTPITFNKDAVMVVARKEHLDGVITAIAASEKTDRFKVSTYPNPSKGDFSLSFVLDKSSNVEARLLDATGKNTATLYRSKLGSGEHVLHFDTEVKGMHILQLIVDGEITAKQILLY